MDNTVNGAASFENSVSSSSDRLISVLDQIEKRVEHFREQASFLEQEKHDLLSALHLMLQSDDLNGMSTCDREELGANAERLICRCLTVDISVSIPRTEVQEQALHRAKEFLANIEQRLKGNFEDMQRTVQSLINACSPEPSADVAPDSKFQAIILGCTAEDQKNIHKRLRKMMDELQRASHSFNHL